MVDSKLRETPSGTPMSGISRRQSTLIFVESPSDETVSSLGTRKKTAHLPCSRHAKEESEGLPMRGPERPPRKNARNKKPQNCQASRQEKQQSFWVGNVVAIKTRTQGQHCESQMPSGLLWLVDFKGKPFAQKKEEKRAHWATGCCIASWAFGKKCAWSHSLQPLSHGRIRRRDGDGRACLYRIRTSGRCCGLWQL